MSLIFSPVVLEFIGLIILSQIVLSVYYCYRCLNNLNKDLEFATTRIFLSDDTKIAFNVLMIVFPLFAIFNFLIVVLMNPEHVQLLLRLNLLLLFSSWLYFFWKIDELTSKS